MNHLNPRAIRKAMKAADHLAKASKLMREAAALTDGTVASGHNDFLAWAHAIDQILSSDNGEAGVGPTMQKLVAEDAAKNPRPKTYPHRRVDGTVVNVTIPED